MPKDKTPFTVFWSHPHHGSGSYVLDNYASAQAAGDDALAELPENMASDDEDELELDSIRDDMTITVYAGKHDSVPARAPDYVVQ